MSSYNFITELRMPRTQREGRQSHVPLVKSPRPLAAWAAELIGGIGIAVFVAACLALMVMA